MNVTVKFSYQLSFTAKNTFSFAIFALD